MGEAPGGFVVNFDVVVIGAGPAGENVAGRVVRGGLSAAIVESELVGGECSFWACIPSKALLRPGEAVAAARAVDGAKQAVTGAIDAGAVLKRRDGFTHGWDDQSQVDWLDNEQITLVRGNGRLAGPRRVEVGDNVLEARHAVVIATGTGASIPPVPGLAEARPWTTREATSAKAPPESLIVLGGGVAGCELAQAWSSLGSRISIVEAADRILPGLEPFASELVDTALRAHGVDIHTRTKATSVSRKEAVEVGLDDGRTLTANEILVAAGRKPQTSDLGLETVGLEPGSWLEADDTLAVRAVDGQWLYAVGDVNRRALLTHQGKYQARICGDVIAARARGDVDTSPWGRHAATADHAAVPSVVFTDPQVASVGLTEQAAQHAGLHVRVVDAQFGDTAGASLFADDYRGQARIVVDEDRRVVVGATFVGPGVSDLLSSATIAVVGEIPVERLWHAVPAFPTMSEIWLRLLEAYGL